MAEKNSLWKNIRNKAKENRRTGATPKKPTTEMINQERKIKAKKYAEGGEGEKLPTYTYANKEGIIGGPTEVEGGTRVPVDANGLPIVNMREFEVVADNPNNRPNPYSPASLKDFVTFINPMNLGLTNYSNEGSFDEAYKKSRANSEKKFIWDHKRYNTNMAGTPAQQLQWSGITNDRLGIKTNRSDKAYNFVKPSVYLSKEDVNQQLKNYFNSKNRFDNTERNKLQKEYTKEASKVNYDLEKIKKIEEKLFAYEPAFHGEDDPYSEDAWRIYLGKPQTKNTFSISNYKPNKSKEANINYYSLPESFKKELYNLYNNKQIKEGVNSEFSFENAFGQNASRARVLGNFTVDKGKDDKGEYISYYDKYDLNPNLPIVGKSFGLDNFVGKPFEIYDRVYLDPKTGKPITEKATGGYYPTQGPPKALFKGYAEGGYTNPYNQYQDDSYLNYAVGGKVWKNIAAGAYGLGEGILDTVTGGATDQLTDKGFEALTKAGNKNIDLNNPDDVKYVKTQQKIKGYTNAGAGIGAGIVTGNVQGAIQQGTKGLNTAFQATDGLSDDFKKVSQGITSVAGIASGFAGGLNSESFKAAQKAGTGAAGFAKKVGKVTPFANQALGMIGGNQQPLWQQGQQAQDYLNSPEYLALQKQGNVSVNQGITFSQGGNITNNSLNLRNTMGYKKFKNGGTLDQHGINFISKKAGLHHQNAYGGVPIGPDALAEGGEAKLQMADGGQYIVSDQVDGANTQTINGQTMAERLKKKLQPFMMGGLASNPKDKENLRRPFDSYSEESIAQIKDNAIQETEAVRMQRGGALQYAANGGKLTKDIEKIVMEEYAAAYGGMLPNKYKGKVNMPNSYAKGGIHIKESKKGTFTAAASKHGKGVQEFARQVLANKENYSPAMVKKANFAHNAAGWKHADGGYVHNQMTQPMLATGGPNDPPNKFDDFYRRADSTNYAQFGLRNDLMKVATAGTFENLEDVESARKFGYNPSIQEFNKYYEDYGKTERGKFEKSRVEGQAGALKDYQKNKYITLTNQDVRDLAQKVVDNDGSYTFVGSMANGSRESNIEKSLNKLDFGRVKSMVDFKMKNKSAGGYYAQGGPVYGDPASPYTYAYGGMYGNPYAEGGLDGIVSPQPITYTIDPNQANQQYNLAGIDPGISRPNIVQLTGIILDAENEKSPVEKYTGPRNSIMFDGKVDRTKSDVSTRVNPDMPTNITMGQLNANYERALGKTGQTKLGVTGKLNFNSANADGTPVVNQFDGSTIGVNLSRTGKNNNNVTVGGTVDPQTGKMGANLAGKITWARGGQIDYTNDMYSMYAGGGPMVSNVQQPFNGPAAQNRGGMYIYADGGMMPQEQQMQQPPQEQMQQQGGQDQMMQMVQQVIQALMQGANPEQIMQQLVQSGIPQDQAQQIVQMAMQEAQSQQQQQPMQGEQQMPPQQGMSTGGRLPKDVLRARVAAHMSPKEADNYVNNYSKGGYKYADGGPGKRRKFGNSYTGSLPLAGSLYQGQLPGQTDMTAQEINDYITNLYVQERDDKRNSLLDIQSGDMNNPNRPLTEQNARYFEGYRKKEPFFIPRPPTEEQSKYMADYNTNTPSNVDNPVNPATAITEEEATLHGWNPGVPKPVLDGVGTSNMYAYPASQPPGPYVEGVSGISPKNYLNSKQPNTKEIIAKAFKFSPQVDNLPDLPNNQLSELPPLKLNDNTSNDGFVSGVDADGNPVSWNPAILEDYDSTTGKKIQVNPNTLGEDWTNTKFQTSPQNNQTTPVGGSEGMSALDYAAMIGQLAGPASQFFQRKTPPYKFQRMTPTTLDPTAPIAIMTEEQRRAQATADYNIKQNAPTSGSYLTNIRANALQSGFKRGLGAADIRSKYDVQNAGILNQANQINTGIANDEIIAKQQDAAARQENKTNALYNAGANIAGMSRDYKQNQINQTIANNIGTPNYKLISDGKGGHLVVYRDVNGNYKAAPYNQAATTNTQPSKVATNTQPPAVTPEVPYTGIASNYLNSNKVPDFSQPTTATLKNNDGTFEVREGNEPYGSRYNNQNISEYVPEPKKEDTDTIKAFQDWLDTFYPEEWKDNGKPLKGGKGYGNFGDQTKAAWDEYGKEFLGRVPTYSRANTNLPVVGFPDGLGSQADSLLNDLYYGI